MSNEYTELKKKHQQEVNDFPIGFAFSNEQFANTMAEWGLDADDADQVVSIGAGGFVRKTDANAYVEMIKKQAEEMKEAIDGDETGDGFVFHMFNYELGNHEFAYTRDPEDTLAALGYDWDDIEADPKLKHALNKAMQACIDYDNGN